MLDKGMLVLEYTTGKPGIDLHSQGELLRSCNRNMMKKSAFLVRTASNLSLASLVPFLVNGTCVCLKEDPRST